MVNNSDNINKANSQLSR